MDVLMPHHLYHVPFGDQRREVKKHGTLVMEAIQRVLDGGWFILGPEVKAFEREFAEWLGVPCSIGVASGTEAITVALSALGVGRGDEVITAANTCVPTATGIAQTGATVCLADCDINTLMISPIAVEAAITCKTRAIVPVHLYGNAADMVELRKIADRYSLCLVEDCAQAIGTQIAAKDGAAKAAGSFGDAAAFSFYPTKNMGAYGDSGCVVTSRPDIAERIRSLRNYGMVDRDTSAHLGLNSRLDELQAAILRMKLPSLNDWNERRNWIAQQYITAFKDMDLKIPATPSYVYRHTYHLFPIMVKNRDDIRMRLQELGIQTFAHYPVPLHLQPAPISMEYKIGTFPNAEWACDHVLSLPIFPCLLNDEVNRVIESVRTVMKTRRC